MRIYAMTEKGEHSENEDRILIMSQFDNLGKGASGAAVQCLNILLGCAEDKGLVL